jgi:hypothetical protein
MLSVIMLDVVMLSVVAPYFAKAHFPMVLQQLATWQFAK